MSNRDFLSYKMKHVLFQQKFLKCMGRRNNSHTIILV